MNDLWRAEAAARVLEVVAQSRATWGQAHVQAEAERQVRAITGPGWTVAGVDQLVDQLTTRALERSIRLDPGDRDDLQNLAANGPEMPDVARGMPEVAEVAVPGALLRADGTSVYRHVQERCWTSQQVMDAERLLLQLAGRTDGTRLDPLEVELTLVETAANHCPNPLGGPGLDGGGGLEAGGGVQLNAGQVGLVRELTLSGARLQVGLAPAGTGKTTAMSMVSRAWTTAGGQVLGLAPSAAAADVLRERLPGHTDTLAKLLHTRSRPQRPGRAGGDSGWESGEDWAWQIGPDTLIVIDEAGMASTPDLAAVAQIALDTGASIRLIGDDQQLAAVGAGGILRDITRAHGAATLTDVVRFEDPVEGAASLALRAGDACAIGWYLDHGRIHVGDDTTAPGQAYRAWTQDIAAGQDSILLAPTHDLVTALNLQARQDRLAHERHTHHIHHTESAGQDGVTLADLTQASAGDTVLTTRNARSLQHAPPAGGASGGGGREGGRWVMNGDRWVVEQVTPAGQLWVRHVRHGGQLLLPADYVRQHVRLGYAATIHAGQGLSVDTAHIVAGPSELTRQLMYVALTRGRSRNDLYLATAGNGEEHSLVYRDTLLPPTAADLLARILQRDGAQISASTTIHHLTNPTARLQAAAARYYDALQAATDLMVGDQRIVEMAEAAELLVPGITQAPAWPALADRLARYDLHTRGTTGREGPDAIDLLTAAVDSGDLGSARDTAAVLDWRLAQSQDRLTSPTFPASPTSPVPAGQIAALPWLPGLPQSLDQDALWGPYLRGRAQLAADIADQVRTEAEAWTPDTAPAWAVTLTRLASIPPTRDQAGDPTSALATYVARFVTRREPLPA